VLVLLLSSWCIMGLLLFVTMSMGLLLPFSAELYSLHSRTRGRATDVSMLASMLLYFCDQFKSKSWVMLLETRWMLME
jgi:hypothetical protein